MATGDKTYVVEKVENEKTLNIENAEQLKEKVSDVEIFGNPDTFTLLCKASSQKEGWMKSTKVCNVAGGCLVQVSTQQKNKDESYAVAEALTFVGGVKIDKEKRELVRI